MESQPGQYGIEGVFYRCWFHPGYWKTLARLLRIDRSKVAFDGSALQFTNYPFEPASVFPSGRVEASEVAEVNLSYPSQVRLKTGEILFVGQDPNHKEALLSFIYQTNVKVLRRSSVWGALLDPFLDTSEEQETIDRQFEWFASLGLDRKAVDRWRREVAISMIAYNFGTKLWEWAILDFYDVLIAQRARLSRRAFQDFYARAMRLAELDPQSTAAWTPSTEEKIIDNALFAVLLDWHPREEGAIKDFAERWQRRTDEIDRLKKRLLAELAAAYSEPHRRYHKLAHVESGLRELGGVWNYAVHLHEVRWAILFHDAIYDPRRQDNEARSADWACRVMEELNRPEEEKARVRAMILATALSNEPRTPDEALLVDIDLAILGSDEATFDRYDRSIREEFAWVPEEAYCQARAEVFRSFLDRDRVYRTAPFRQRYEEAARGNLQRALS